MHSAMPSLFYHDAHVHDINKLRLDKDGGTIGC